MIVNDDAPASTARATGQLIYVMGPSGAGKDSLLDYARARLAPLGVVFARRYITRADGDGEDHIALTDPEFETHARNGRFALQWRSHALRYGIGVEIDQWLARGCVVIVNGSREYAHEALARYPHTMFVHVEAAPALRAARLASRGRETPAQIAARVARRVPLDLPAGARVVRIDNSSGLAEAGDIFVAVVRRAMNANDESPT